MTASRVWWIRGPVDRSITVSAPQRVAQVSFSTSSATEEVTAEVPMLALTFTRNREPITIGSDSGWLRLTGSTARPAAISSRIRIGSTPSRIAANSISGVISPARARANWVRPLVHDARSGGRPTSGSLPGPEVSYRRNGSLPSVSGTSVKGTRRSGRDPSTYTFLLILFLPKQYKMDSREQHGSPECRADPPTLRSGRVVRAR